MDKDRSQNDNRTNNPQFKRIFICEKPLIERRQILKSSEKGIAARVQLAGADARSASDIASVLTYWQQVREAQTRRENIEMEDAQMLDTQLDTQEDTQEIESSEMEDTQEDTQEDYVMTWTYTIVGAMAYRQLVINNEDVGPPEVVGLDLVVDIWCLFMFK